MKFNNICILLLFIMILDFSSSYSSKYSSRKKYHEPNVLVIKKMKIEVGAITLANIFKRIGSRSRTLDLAIRIQKRCKGKKILNNWLKIIKHYKNVINLSTKRPFNLKRFWYVHHKQRISLYRQFLKSFIKCGKVKGTNKQLRRIYKVYFSIKFIRKRPLIRLVKQLKKIFMRSKRLINKNKKLINKTIYPTKLLLKMIRMRNYINSCTKYRKSCRIYGSMCHKFRFVCKFASKFREGIIYKVRRIFAYYFSVLFSGLLLTSKYRKMKLKLRKNKNSGFFYNTPF
jgi:hypothetical protein